MNSTYNIQNYEFMDDPSIKIHQRVSCRVPENGIEPVRGVILPIPNLVLPIITREKALEAFKAYVNGNCCWDHSFLRNLEVETSEMLYCYKIVLDNLFEARYASWEETFLGAASLSSPDLGVPPSPWSLQFASRGAFSEGEQSLPLPFTEVPKACKACAGSGRMICEVCKGRGSLPCSSCANQPDSLSAPLNCRECQGNGFVFCKTCQGLGTLSCSACNGTGQTKQFLQVTSETRSHTLTSIVENGGLIKEYLELLQGTQIYHINGPRLLEGDRFYDDNVNRAVHNLLSQAVELERDYEVVLRQQQLTIFVIPVCTLHCNSDGHQFFASVFDSDLKVFCPDYPVQKLGLWKNLSSCSVM